MAAAVTPKLPDLTPALSFAAVTRRRQADISPPVQLAARQYGLKDGKPTVSFTQTELQPGLDRLQHSLIAKFSAGRPGIEDVRRLLIQAWGIDEPITIGAMDARHILIIIPSAVLANQILSHPARKVGNYLFRLFRWAQDFKRKKEPTTTTSWIRLPGLPTELFNAGYIQAITSPIGRFLAIDEGTRTSRNPSFARACVEIDLSKPVLDEVWINMGITGGFWQEIVYENKLLYCSHCKLHGHSMENCRKVKTKNDQEQLIWAARDEFGLSTVKGKDTVPQDKHGEPKSLSKNKEHVSSLSATEQEKGWMVVQKKKGKLTNVPLNELPVVQSEKQQKDLAFEKEGCINSEPKSVSGTQGISTNKKKPKGKASVPAGPFPLGHEKEDVVSISPLSNESNPNGITCLLNPTNQHQNSTAQDSALATEVGPKHPNFQPGTRPTPISKDSDAALNPPFQEDVAPCTGKQSCNCKQCKDGVLCNGLESCKPVNDLVSQECLPEDGSTNVSEKEVLPPEDSLKNGNASSGKNGETHRSDLQLVGETSEAIAAKYKKVPVTADKDNQVVRSQFLDDYIIWSKENGEFEDFLDYCKKQGFFHSYGSSITIEDSARVDEDHIITHNSDYDACNQDEDTIRKPIPGKTRSRKKEKKKKK